jgi:prephenate dehydrogenase
MDDDGFAGFAGATVAVVGLGLMGGSLGMALRQRRLVGRVVGVVRRPEVAAQAIRLGAADATTTDLAEGVRGAALVVLATPVRTILEQIPRLEPHLADGAIVTDLGSTKTAITQTMAALPGHVQPIGGHPMCGKEVAGLAAAEPSLFDGATWALTPLQRTRPATIERMRALVQAVGARPLMVEPDRHDRLVAAISHLPYLLAVSLTQVAEVVGQDDDAVWRLAASGFRDTSRLAASDVQMMLDILITNRRYVRLMLQSARARLADLDRLLDDETALRAVLEAAQAQRAGWRPGG